MKPLTFTDCSRIREAISAGTDLRGALKRLGVSTLGGGVWRLFSDGFPSDGVDGWNDKSPWRAAWGIAASRFLSFGEDLFGNQLVLRPEAESAFLWNHENGELNDLLLDPVTLLETVVESGVDWIDFYGDGSLAVAQDRILDVPAECHLHWTTPLILGGPIDVRNTSVIERVSHLIGHAELWRHIRDLPPGTMIVPN
jgi:hypothetical protein